MTYTLRWKYPAGRWTVSHLVDKDHRATRCHRPLPNFWNRTIKFQVGDAVPLTAPRCKHCLDPFRY
jgi:hypothetical protein